MTMDHPSHGIVTETTILSHSIEEVTFINIEMAAVSNGVQGPADVLLRSSSGGVTNTGTAVDLKYTQVTNTLIPAGQPALLSFSLKLLRPVLPNTVGRLQPGNLQVDIVTSVTV